VNPTALELPARAAKPRTTGLTMMVDGGLPTRGFQDIVESGAEYLDFVKFGWGTAIVTSDLHRKIEILDGAGVDYYFGGTLFEKFVLQDRFDDFREMCHSAGCSYVEVSNGTIDLSAMEKVGYITKLADDFRVVSEVGFKDSERSERFAPTRWIEDIHDDLDAGAFLVTLEARESGKSGICRPNGELRFGLIEEILASDVPVDRLLFEAPSNELQCYFVRRVGTDVNLGNIPSTTVIGLETIRLGLRSDTLDRFEARVS
jgi:phosphosulfolactate synthase